MANASGTSTEELRRELTRRDCAERGHAPDVVVRTWGGPATSALCECRAVIWTPRPAS